MYKVLFNPHSGNGKGKENIKKLTSAVGNAELFDMTEVNSYKEFFAGLGEEDDIIIAGGDGTLNRFINDTADIDIPCRIFYYAMGSGNDFARDIGLAEYGAPVDITEYLKDLPSVTVKGKTYKFLNNMGYGIDGYCCEVGDSLREKGTQDINYAGIAIKGLLFHYKPANAVITVDGEEYRFRKVWLAPTMKGRFYGGGMMPTPAQDRNDPEGKVSVLVMHGAGKLHTLIVFPSIFKGEHIKHEKMCTVLTGHEIKVEYDRPVAAQVDGETVLGVTEYSVSAKAKSKVNA